MVNPLVFGLLLEIVKSACSTSHYWPIVYGRGEGYFVVEDVKESTYLSGFVMGGYTEENTLYSQADGLLMSIGYEGNL
jgi:hypothetical protein